MHVRTYVEGPADAGQSVRAEIFRINSCGDCVFQNSYLNPFSPRKCQTSRALSNDEKSASLSSPRGNFFRLFFLSVKVSIVHPSNLVPFPPLYFLPRTGSSRSGRRSRSRDSRYELEPTVSISTQTSTLFRPPQLLSVRVASAPPIACPSLLCVLKISVSTLGARRASPC